MLSDIQSYILIEYQYIKLESKLNYKDSDYFDSLVILLSKHFVGVHSLPQETIKQSILKSQNAIELLKKLKLK